MRYVSSSQLGESFKITLVRTLGVHTWYTWMLGNGFSARYTEEFHKETWIQLYTMLHIAAGEDLMNRCMNSSDVYLSHRDSLLSACDKHFTHQELGEEEEQAFNLFLKWVSKGTKYTVEDLKRQLHISHYKHACLERDVWKDCYEYTAA